MRVHATTVTEGWRAVRTDLADLGNTPASTQTTHDCAQPPKWLTAVGEYDTVPLFTPIDRHGAPESWVVSTRSITTIVATRLANPNSLPSLSDSWHDPGPTVSPSGRVWDETDRARVQAERKAAAARCADIESSLDLADAYAETILERLDAALNADPPGSSNGDGDRRRVP